MSEPKWISLQECNALHAVVLERFGGLEGVREDGLLESALQRPKNLFSYDGSDLFSMAAAYATGIMKNHPFIDGNKRTGFMCAALFLETNGLRFQATEEEVAERTLALAASAIDETEYAAWLKRVCVDA